MTNKELAAQCLIEAAELLSESGGANSAVTRYDSLLAKKETDKEFAKELANKVAKEKQIKRSSDKKSIEEGKRIAKESRDLIKENLNGPKNKKLHDKINKRSQCESTDIDSLLAEAIEILEKN